MHKRKLPRAGPSRSHEQSKFKPLSEHDAPPRIISAEPSRIRNVWKYNAAEEFHIIRTLPKQYCYVAMDTEFPGVVASLVNETQQSPTYLYNTLRANVDILVLIQLGLTFMDEYGRTPPGISCWQFNFKFDLAEDAYIDESITLLLKAGIDFEQLYSDGLEPREFAEFFYTSGLLFEERITWITFHSCYDFGYLWKILMNRKLPETEVQFFETLWALFPKVYDLKFLMLDCGMHGGLQGIAGQLNIRRVGIQHQAGSDSLVTGSVFFRMKETYFNNNIMESRYRGRLYGFGHKFSDPWPGDTETTFLVYKANRKRMVAAIRRQYAFIIFSVIIWFLFAIAKASRMLEFIDEDVYVDEVTDTTKDDVEEEKADLTDLIGAGAIDVTAENSSESTLKRSASLTSVENEAAANECWSWVLVDDVPVQAETLSSDDSWEWDWDSAED